MHYFLMLSETYLEDYFYFLQVCKIVGEHSELTGFYFKITLGYHSSRDSCWNTGPGHLNKVLRSAQERGLMKIPALHLFH